MPEETNELSVEEAVIALGPIRKIVQAFYPLEQILQAASTARAKASEAEQEERRWREQIAANKEEAKRIEEEARRAASEMKRGAEREVEGYKADEIAKTETNLGELRRQRAQLLEEVGGLRNRVNVLRSEQESEAQRVSRLRETKERLEHSVSSLKAQIQGLGK